MRLPATCPLEDEAEPPPLLLPELPVLSGGSTLIWIAFENIFFPSTSMLAAGIVYVPSFPAIKMYVKAVELLDVRFPLII